MLHKDLAQLFAGILLLKLQGLCQLLRGDVFICDEQLA
jgi:hypothetical protein